MKQQIVNFKFDKKKDIYNVWQTCRSKPYWQDFAKYMPQDIVKICKKKNFNNSKKDIEKKFERIYSSGHLEIFVEALNKSWAKIEKEYFKRLKKIMKKPIKFKKITGYLTISSRCPYNLSKKEKWFMTSFFVSLPGALHITGHEIMHFQFHEHYWKFVEKEIGKDKTADLKEALTVLLNLEFRDLWDVEDKGYMPHKNLRKFIEKEWKKEKDFDVLLNKCIKDLKKQKYIKNIKKK